MINYENEVAVKCGINAAVIADYLWNLKENHRFGKGKSVRNQDSRDRRLYGRPVSHKPLKKIHVSHIQTSSI